MLVESLSVFCDKQQALKGTTKLQVERLGELRRAGIDIWPTRGSNGASGTQHSKTLLVDGHFIVGSCNWTNNSRTNTEMNVLLELNVPGQKQLTEIHLHLEQRSRLFSVSDEEMGREHRSAVRARSQPPRETTSTQPEMYRTAQRWRADQTILQARESRLDARQAETS